MTARIVGGVMLVAAGLFVACSGVDFVARPDTTMGVSANPAEVVSTTGTSRITAVLVRSSGVPAADGTVVRFTTTLGAITGQDETTDGIAVAELTGTSVPGMATVTAFSGSVNASVDVTIGATASSLALSATPASLPTGGGTVELVATVFGENGAPVEGQAVAFSTTEGSLDTAGNPVLTDIRGVATDSLTTSRTADVTATAGAQSQTVTVQVGDTGVTALVLSATQVNLPSGGGSTGLTAVVLGNTGPVANVPVAWSASAGSLGTPGSTLTDANGQATNSISTTVDSVVSASAAAASDSLTITVGLAPTITVAISASRSSIPLLDPVTTRDCSTPNTTSLPIDIVAQVEDQDGKPVANRQVTFFVDFSVLSSCALAFGEFCGSGSSSVTATTASDGTATVQFMMTEEDVGFCNCLPSSCVTVPGTGVGECNSSSGCGPMCTTTDDKFCSVAISALSGGTLSDNIQFIEYGR